MSKEVQYGISEGNGTLESIVKPDRVVAATDVFTPTMPARLAFVEREAINSRLVNALRTPGKQIIVYGHSGSGKSTLLTNKLRQLYEDHVTTRCTSNLAFETLVLHAFDQLDEYYDAERASTARTTASAALSGLYLGIKTQIGAQRYREEGAKQQRLLPPQLTSQNLARLLGASRSCWVLEDFHKLNPEEKVKLSQTMKVFMDMAAEFPDLKIIALGAVDTARQVVEYEREMTSRVAEIHVTLMADDELRQIVSRGQELLNFEMPEEVQAGIVHYSNGLASVCHQLCLNICMSADIVETLPETMCIDNAMLTRAVSQYVEEASDTLKSAFDRAFRQKRTERYDNGKLIVEALATSAQGGMAFGALLESVRESEPDYPAPTLTRHLKALQAEERGGLVRYDSASETYSFADPIFRAFALTQTERSPIRPARGVEFVDDWGSGTQEDVARLIQSLLSQQANDERVRLPRYRGPR